LTPEQFQGFASLLSEPFFWLSGNGQILSLNSAAANLLGLKTEEVLNKSLSDFIIDPHEKLKNYLRHCSRSKQKIISSLNLCQAGGQVVKVRAEGVVTKPWTIEGAAQILLQLRTTDLASSRFLELNKRIDQLAKEIRQRQRVEQEHEELLRREQEARREAEAANRLKDEFLATASHELRTPLNAILGWARLLRSGLVKEDAADRALETIERNAKIQGQLIDDILDVSRIITGKLRLDVNPIDLSPVVDATVDVVRPSAENKQIRLQIVLDPKAGPVAGDSSRLQQIIWNLLSNAIKFTPKGGPCPGPD
jgi:PAS domain S-box-containing protein